MQVVSKKEQAVSLSPQSKITNSLEPQELKIYEVSLKSKKIKDFSEVELKVAANMLLLKINVITGWSFPVGDDEDQTKVLHNILKEQFFLKLQESYGNLNLDEIQFSFRNYPVKDWGKSINLNLMDEVVSAYMAEKQNLSGYIANKVSYQEEQKIYTDEEILNQRREEIELKYQAMRNGKILPIPQYLEDVLIKDFNLKEETAADFFVWMLKNKKENIYKKEN